MRWFRRHKVAKLFVVLLSVLLLATTSATVAAANHGGGNGGGGGGNHNDNTGTEQTQPGGGGTGQTEDSNGDGTPAEGGTTGGTGENRQDESDHDSTGNDGNGGSQGDVNKAGQGGNEGSGSGDQSTGGKPDEVGPDTGGEKSITLTITVNGLNAGQEAPISISKKAEEGEPPYTDSGVTTNHTVVFSGIPLGGSVTVSGADVPGYITPAPLSIEFKKLKGNFEKSGSLTYQKAESIPVEEVVVKPSQVSLLKGQTTRVDASVIPANASNQEVVWATSNGEIATVDENGTILGVAAGSAVISATVTDGDDTFSAESTVTVKEIASFASFETIHAITGQKIILPSTVEAVLTDGSSQAVEVEWLTASKEGNTQIVSYDNADRYTLIGVVVGTELQPELTISVTGESVIGVERVLFSEGSLNVFIGKTEVVGIQIIPEGANTESLIWESSDPSIATVSFDSAASEVEITGEAAGNAIITAKNLEGKTLGQFFANVTIDPTVTDPVRILATTENSAENVDQFGSPEEVFLRGFNLPPGTYYIKVESKGSDPLLGQATFLVEEGQDVLLNLLELTGFKLTDNYSKSYWVYISQDPNFPKGDDEEGLPKTYQDNFKIGSPVPTVPKEDVHVNVVFLDDGEFKVNPDFVGLDVILARELDVSTEDVKYSDYLNPAYDSLINPDAPKYIDEVKLVGEIDLNGKVVWKIPKETLKLGGYVLLIEMPEGDYTSNLGLINPVSEDGELVKEVHIERGGTIYRQIVIQVFYGDPVGEPGDNTDNEETEERPTDDGSNTEGTTNPGTSPVDDQGDSETDGDNNDNIGNSGDEEGNVETEQPGGNPNGENTSDPGDDQGGGENDHPGEPTGDDTTNQPGGETGNNGNGQQGNEPGTNEPDDQPGTPGDGDNEGHKPGNEQENGDTGQPSEPGNQPNETGNKGDTQSGKKVVTKPTVTNKKATVDNKVIETIDVDSTLEFNLAAYETANEITAVLSGHQVTSLKGKHAVIAIDKGDVHLDIPAAVLTNGDEEVNIIIKKINGAPDAISAVYDFTIEQGGRIISTFKERVTIQLAVNEQKVKNPENVKIFYWNETKKAWELIGGQYKNGVVTATTSHFSKYAAFETADEQLVATAGTGTSINRSTDQNENELPNTATNVFNWLIVGAAVTGMGLLLTIFKKRRHA